MPRYISNFVLAMLAYYISGKLGLALAIPPGFASAVWPASGVALACVLLMKKIPAGLGVAAGSFLLNLGITSQGYSEISIGTLQPAVFISIGAITQCLLGAYLFERLIGYPSLIDMPRDILRFTLIVGPIGCLTAASVGVTTLHFNGLITESNYLFSWLTWWLGDTIGVLLFTPLLLMIFSQHEHFLMIRKIQTAIPTLAIFFGILVLFFTSMKTHQENMDIEIHENGKHYFQMIEDRLKISNSKLNSYSAFYYVSENVSQQEFNSFSNIILKDDNVFQGIGWTEVIPKNKRKQYEENIRNNGHPDFGFKELQNDGSFIQAPVHDEYYPVLYIYPLSKNIQAFGLNLSANPQRLDTLMNARKLAKAFSTPPVHLAQENSSQFGYIIYMPVFNTQSTEADRFKGYISGVFRVNGLFGDVIEKAKGLNYGMTIRDITDTQEPVLLIKSNISPLSSSSTLNHNFDFGGRKIQATFYANNNFKIASRDWTSWGILTGGFLIVALLQSFILVITGQTENIKREVSKKTRELTKAKLRAEDASIAKSNFTANISHEIRTPLNAIIGLTNLCSKTPLNNDQKDHLQKIQLASSTLLSLINQTLDYSKIESGYLVLEEVEFDLPNLINKIQAIFSIQALQKNIDFYIELPPTLPDILLGDPLRLEQILLNLCSNACKFTNSGSVKLILEIESHTSEADIKFTVADTGIGIPIEQQDKLFQSYQQADSSTTRKFGGTGLGLTISKQLVELMGGSISLTSEQNKGSRFTISLKMKVPSKSRLIKREDISINDDASHILNTDTSSSLSKADDVEVKNKLDNVSILLVEDILVNQLIAKAVLKSNGAKVTTALNGIEALEKLSSDAKFDLILMDIQMPEMDGYETTRRIRENPETSMLPIIAMTANAMSTDIDSSKAAGMNDHISKPFEEGVLIEKIRAQLNLI